MTFYRDYIIKQSIASLYVHLLQKEFKAASNMMHSMRLIIELFGFPESEFYN